MKKSCARCKAWNDVNCLLGYSVTLLTKDKWVFWKTDILNGFYVKIKPESNCKKPLTNKRFQELFNLTKCLL